MLSTTLFSDCLLRVRTVSGCANPARICLHLAPMNQEITLYFRMPERARLHGSSPKRERRSHSYRDALCPGRTQACSPDCTHAPYSGFLQPRRWLFLQARVSEPFEFNAKGLVSLDTSSQLRIILIQHRWCSRIKNSGKAHV